jgi:hypothetical protein
MKKQYLLLTLITLPLIAISWVMLPKAVLQKNTQPSTAGLSEKNQPLTSATISQKRFGPEWAAKQDERVKFAAEGLSKGGFKITDQFLDKWYLQREEKLNALYDDWKLDSSRREKVWSLLKEKFRANLEDLIQSAINRPKEVPDSSNSNAVAEHYRKLGKKFESAKQVINMELLAILGDPARLQKLEAVEKNINAEVTKKALNKLDD